MLAPQLAYSEDYVYYIYKNKVFVYQGHVIASGDFNYVSEEYDGLTLDEWIVKQKRKEEEIARFAEERFDMYNSPKRTYEKEVEEEKVETPEFEIENIESMEFKNADTSETVMELSVPTADELDNYFSSIGYSEYKWK